MGSRLCHRRVSELYPRPALSLWPIAQLSHLPWRLEQTERPLGLLQQLRCPTCPCIVLLAVHLFVKGLHYDNTCCTSNTCLRFYQLRRSQSLATKPAPNSTYPPAPHALGARTSHDSNRLRMSVNEAQAKDTAPKR